MRDGRQHKSNVSVGQTEHGIEHLNAMVQVRVVVGPHRDIKNGHHIPPFRIGPTMMVSEIVAGVIKKSYL